MTLAECPKCDRAYPELDEEGRAYSCFFCGDTGRVPSAVARAYWQGLQDEEERFAPSRLGIFVRPRPMWHEDDYGDDEPAPAAGHRLFTRIPEIARSIDLAQRATSAAAFQASRVDDDLPY